MLNARGETLSTSRVPNRILAGAISDEGSLIALLVEADGAGLLLLSADFDILSERPAPSEASFVTIDPHGRYLAVGTRHNALHLINRYRPASGPARDDGAAVASLLRARPPAHGRRRGVRHARGHRAGARAGRRGGSIPRSSGKTV